MSSNESSDRAKDAALSGQELDRDSSGVQSPDSSAPSGRTAVAVSALLAASSALGLLRDLSLAGLFGASGETDAFLVAWTIPETVSVLLLEGAISYLLIPVFVRELSLRGGISRIVQLTLLAFLSLVLVLTAVVLVSAPLLTDLLAPGIAERQLAIDCLRIAAFTVLFMGASGYMMAALRANHRFLTAASTYVAYNLGILATMFALHQQLGVRSAALGLAIGSALMVLIQVRAFLRCTSLRGLRLAFDRRLLVAASAFVPIAAYSLGRQMQTFVERIVGSTLGEGAISHMNYATKVAQMASLLALTAAAVAFPSLARIAADPEALRQRIEQELRRLVLLIMPAMAFLCVFAEPTIRLLFQRGAFQPADTAQTADVLRIYCLGLLGQVLVTLGIYVCFGGRRRSWRPAVAAATGLLVTIVLDVALAPILGVVALAVGNAAGITVSAVLIWIGIRRRIVHIHMSSVWPLVAWAAALAAITATLAWVVCRLLPANAFLEVAVGGTLTVVLFLLTTAFAGVHESRDLVGVLRRSGRSATDWLGKGGR